MTAQVSDGFRYLGQEMVLVGINGAGLFDPREHGLQPEMMATACWRGYVCSYELRDGALHLAHLAINLSEEQDAAVRAGALSILGVRPTRWDDVEGWQLDDLGPVAFTGGLLLGDRFVSGLYVHMGFHPAWKYEVVHELLFTDGRLTSAADRSAEMAEFRAAMRDRPLAPDGGDEAEVRAWIERTFSRDYRG